jgi:hypothetical protein
MNSPVRDFFARVAALPMGEGRVVKLEHLDSNDGAEWHVTVTLIDDVESRDRFFVAESLDEALRSAGEGVDEWIEELRVAAAVRSKAQVDVQ